MGIGLVHGLVIIAMDATAAGINHMHACCCELDLMTDSNDHVSLDDWGSCGEAVGKIVCGCLVHSVLPNAHRRALPDWSSMIHQLRPIMTRREVRSNAWLFKLILGEL